MHSIKEKSLILASSILGTTDLEKIISFSEMIYEFLKDNTTPDIDSSLKSNDIYRDLSRLIVQHPAYGSINMILNENIKSHLNFMSENNKTIYVSYRQSGKTTNLMSYAFLEILKGRSVLFLVHSGAMCSNVINQFESSFNGINIEIPKITHKRSQTIIFENGGVFTCRPISVDASRGTKIDTVLIDEAAYMNHSRFEEFMFVILPCINKNAQLHLVTTLSEHNGPFDKLLMDPQFRLMTLPYSKSNSYNKNDEMEWRHIYGDKKYDLIFECRK